MNRIKKSIGWTDKTINPIKGMCKGGCWYCWTKGFYERNFLTPEIRLELEVFNKLPKRIPKKVFLCSTHDLYGDWIPEGWRQQIFYEIENHPQHTFQILTKFPENVDREMPDNMWLGVSITDYSEIGRWTNLYIKQKARIKFVSFEPLLRRLKSFPSMPDWVIIGRLTGHGYSWQPEKTWIEEMVEWYQSKNISIFLKNNLIPIMGKEYVMKYREFPE